MKIIINIDGTCNEPSDAEEKKNLDDESISNILRTHLLLGGNIDNEAMSIPGQKSLYYPGVGTRGNFFKRLFRSMFASLAPDVILKEITDDLEATWEPGDTLYVFGFSRGAAIARILCSQLAKDTRFPGIQVEFLGVYDTVAAFGIPNLDSDEKPVSDVLFENNAISPVIKNAVHLVALDENRKAFRPTLMDKDPRVKEVWYPGVHSDVGGGYYIRGLSDIALLYMIIEAELHGLKFFDPEVIPDDNRSGLDQNGEPVEISIDDLLFNPSVYGKIHYHMEWWRTAKTRAARDAVVLDDGKVSGDRVELHPSVTIRAIEFGYKPIAVMNTKCQICGGDTMWNYPTCQTCLQSV